MDMLKLGIVIVVILLAFISDIKTRKIRNKLTLSAVMIGLLLNLMENGYDGLFYSLKGLLFGFILLFIVYVLKGVGAGDVKLFAGVGAIMGSNFILDVWVYSLIFGSLIGIVLLLFKRHMRSFLETLLSIFLTKSFSIKGCQEGESHKIPFMYAVLPGTVLAVLLPLNIIP